MNINGALQRFEVGIQASSVEDTVQAMSIRKNFKAGTSGWKCRHCGATVHHPKAAAAHLAVHHEDKMEACDDDMKKMEAGGPGSGPRPGENGGEQPKSGFKRMWEKGEGDFRRMWEGPPSKMTEKEKESPLVKLGIVEGGGPGSGRHPEGGSKKKNWPTGEGRGPINETKKGNKLIKELAKVGVVDASGTSEGVHKAWETRHGGVVPQEAMPRGKQRPYNNGRKQSGFLPGQNSGR